jgi:large subunit ribosomal protein L15
VSIAKILEAVEAGRLDAGQTIDAEALRNAGVIRRTREGVRLLGGAEVTTALTFDVAGASRPAIAAIEQAGGKITVANPAAAAEEAA